MASRPCRAAWTRKSISRPCLLYDVDSEQFVESSTGQQGEVTALTFTPDGNRIFSGDGDRSARLWETSTGKQIREFRGHDDPITCVAVLPDGRRALTASGDRTIRVWDLEKGSEARRFD